MRLVIKSERVLSGGEISPLQVEIDNGVITKVSENFTEEGIDLGDMLITAGFVDLHSDAIEKEIEPRPGAYFPVEKSVFEMDKKLAVAGVTTMFHAVSFETQCAKGIRNPENAAELMRTIKELNSKVLRVDNRLHLRFEVSAVESIPVVKDILESGVADLLSVMDHTPGQGQFKTVESWEAYYSAAYKMGQKEMDEIREMKMRRDDDALAGLVKTALDKGLSIASHDDCSIEKVKAMMGMGVTISEFPLSLDVASFAKESGVATGMGAPNVVRGGSQSGNIAAKDLIVDGVCDYLCSDYHPLSLLSSVYAMRDTLRIPLEEGFKMVSSTPARIAGLSDRGDILEGMRADIVAVEDDFVPSVAMTISGGEIAHNMTGNYCRELKRV